VVVPKGYKDNWKSFQKDKIEPKLDVIIESLSKLEGQVENNFDAFPHHGVLSNVGLASMLLMIYGSCGKTWIEKKKEYLVKPTKNLIDNRIPGEGWPYDYASVENAQTLPTWLSMAALEYIPEDVGNEITDDNWDKVLEEIKDEVRNWLVSTMDKDGENNCCWSFRPGKLLDEYNPVATAQAILALYHTGVTDKDDINIKCAINYIKNNKSDMSDEESPYKTERLVQRVGQITHISHAGIQQCLQALLLFEISPEDEMVQDLLNEVIKIIPNLNKDDELDISSCYATIRPLLLSLPSTRPMVLLDSSALINEFKSFISGAESILLVGEIDRTYANFIPETTRVTVFCRDAQEELVLEDHGWKDNSYWIDCRFETINCVIADEIKGLFSTIPFKAIKNRYNRLGYLKSDEVSLLIDQLEESTGRLSRHLVLQKILCCRRCTSLKQVLYLQIKNKPTFHLHIQK